MKLKNYLQDNKIKPSVFAGQLGVAPSTITRLLKGERTPRIYLVAQIAQATNGAVSFPDFLPDGAVWPDGIVRPVVEGGAGDGADAG